AVAGVSGFGFGGANAHLVVREVLPRDVVEKEAPEKDETEAPVAQEASEPEIEYEAPRFDEYGEFIQPDSAHGYGDEPEYELPGLTDEALRLRDEALAELAAQEPVQPLIPLAISAFLTSRKKAAAAELADWIDSEEGRATPL